MENVEKAHMARNGGQPLVNSQWKTEALHPTSHERVNPATNHVMLEANSSSINKLLLNKLQIDHSPADILGNEEPSSCGMPYISVNHLLKNLGLAKRVSLPPSFSKGGNKIQFMGDRTGTWSCVLVISPHSLHHVCRGGGRTKDQRAVKKKPELIR